MRREEVGRAIKYINLKKIKETTKALFLLKVLCRYGYISSVTSFSSTNWLSTHDEGVPSRSWEFIDIAGKSTGGSLAKIIWPESDTLCLLTSCWLEIDIQSSLNSWVRGSIICVFRSSSKPYISITFPYNKKLFIIDRKIEWLKKNGTPVRVAACGDSNICGNFHRKCDLFHWILGWEGSFPGKVDIKVSIPGRDTSRMGNRIMEEI